MGILAEIEQPNSFNAPKDQNTTSAPPKDHFTLPKGISFDPNTKLTQRDASNLIQQAQDKAEEVDTIAFGLELNDGEIVKVYVATPDAEGFEKAMSDLLGKEDDIETAINDLAGEFDIVSVEWPEDDMTGDGSVPGGGEEVGDAAMDNEGDGNVDDLADKKEKKTKLGFNLNSADDDEEGGKDKEEGGDEDNLEGPSDDDKKDDEGEDDAFGGLDFGKKDDDSEEEEEEEDKPDTEEEEPEDKEKPTPPKKKPASKKKPAGKKKEELKDSIQQSSHSWLFSSFLNEDTLSEESKKEDEAEEKIEDLFKTAMQRKIIRLIILLGMPALRLSQGKSLLRHGVREAALGMVNNPKGRIFLHRSLKELEDILGTGEADKAEKELTSAKSKKEKIDEASTSHGTTAMFEYILQLLEALGVPHDLLHSRKSLLRQALKPTIVHLIKHGKLRNYVAGLAKALGIKQVHPHEESDEDTIVKEAVDLGNDAYLSLVSTLASSLGIPDDNLNYKRSNLIQALRQRKQQLNLPAVRVRAAALAKTLSSGSVNEEELQVVYEEAYRHLRDKAVDLGMWSIGKTGERVRFAIDSLEIKLSSTEAKNLHHAIDNGFETTISSGNEHYNFKPFNHGVEYVVIPLDSDNEFHKDGIKLGKKSVEAFLNLW